MQLAQSITIVAEGSHTVPYVHYDAHRLTKIKTTKINSDSVDFVQEEFLLCRPNPVDLLVLVALHTFQIYKN